MKESIETNYSRSRPSTCSAMYTTVMKGAGKTVERPLLADVTLVAVTSVALAATVEALNKSMRQAQFGRVLLLSDQAPSGAVNGITWRPIQRLACRAYYSRFMLGALFKHIETSHALCIQWDGFVLNGQSWDPQFLNYDYIGAVWPQFSDGYNVGNGGFSLRSRRLLRACRDLPFDSRISEDIAISRRYRAQLEGQGIRFAPDEVARAFAYERTAPSGREFGFHGVFNLVRYLSSRDAALLFHTLEPEVLARSEHYELLRWALSRGQLRLTLAILSKLRRRRSADPR